MAPTTQPIRRSLGAQLCRLLVATALGCGAGTSAFGQGASAVIAVYHHVSTQTPASTSLSPAQFTRHLDLLQEQDQAVIALPSLLDALQHDAQIPDRAVAITFDDGYESIFTTAFPLLQQAGMDFTVFVSTGPIDRAQRGYMNWDQLRMLVEAGVTIGNHGTEHASLLEMSADEIRSEVLAAQRRIDEELGVQPRLFAYPYGEYSLEAKAVLKELGYLGLAQNSGAVGSSSDFQAIPRFPLAGIYADSEGASQKFLTLAFDLRALGDVDPVTTSPAPSVTLQLRTRDFEGIGCFDQGAALELQRQDSARITLLPEARERGRRWHYICTARLSDSERYYWYSQPWFDPSQPQ